ncbi:MAG TPA: hypothetical protein VJS44_00895 [Pyrinomonadaceae bacterium]|nr:hypothetical protein [Pyrinomonadaceae bacterium]
MSSSINLELPDEALDKIAERVLAKLQESGQLNSPKKWLSMREAKEASGLSAWEIKKRIKAGTVEAHQPNPGKPPLRINRISLLRSMDSIVDSQPLPTRKEA